MKKTSIALLVIGLIFLSIRTSFAYDQISYPTDDLYSSHLKFIKKLAALPENKIDIGRVALLLNKQIQPELDVDAYSAKIDEMVAKVKALTKGSTDPDTRIRCLDTYLYKMEGIHYDKSDPYVKNLDNRFLKGLIDRKMGSCASMPLLYLAIAQRLGYPVYPVVLPQHYILRYVDPKFKEQNIEATEGGGYSSDEEYAAVLEISPKAIKSGAYLRTMTYREFVGELIHQNAIHWGSLGYLQCCKDYQEISIESNPRSADSIRSLGKTYQSMSKKLTGALKSEYQKKAKYCLKKADNMGATNLKLEGYPEQEKEAYEKYMKQKAQGATK